MKLSSDQLGGYLARNLPPAFVVSGDEPLLVQEACDAIRARAREQGASERTLAHAGASGFDWGEWLQQSLNGSLFSPRQVIEVRLPSGKPGDVGASVLEDYAQHASPDNVLLVVTDKLDRAVQNSRWLAALERIGVLVQVWPLTRERLPAWITQRMRARGLQPTTAAVALLVERTEGNALACAQEIDKLALLVPPGPVDEDTLAEASVDSARFDVFALTDAALQGDAARAARILARLREEGTEPLYVLWALARELRTLWVLAALPPREREPAFAAHKIWDKRKPLVSKALSRLDRARLEPLLAAALVVDRVSKGDLSGAPWDELLKLTLALAGTPLFAAAE